MAACIPDSGNGAVVKDCDSVAYLLSSVASVIDGDGLGDRSWVG